MVPDVMGESPDEADAQPEPEGRAAVVEWPDGTAVGNGVKGDARPREPQREVIGTEVEGKGDPRPGGGAGVLDDVGDELVEDDVKAIEDRGGRACQPARTSTTAPTWATSSTRAGKHALTRVEDWGDVVIGRITQRGPDENYSRAQPRDGAAAELCECGRTATPGFKTCGVCRRGVADRRTRTLAIGRCERCPAPARPGRVTRARSAGRPAARAAARRTLK